MDKNKKRTAIIISIVFVVGIVILLLLVPIEEKRKLYEEWGELAVIAETDERAEFIIENKELYPEDILNFKNYEVYLDFIYNYPFHKDDYDTMTFTDSELNCEGIPALYMTDFRWCYEKMNGSYIRKTGCMALSITMANIFLNRNSNVDPKKVALIYEGSNDVDYWGGLDNDDTKYILDEIGLKYNLLDYTDGEKKVTDVELETIAEIIDNKHVCIACMKGETFGSHALIIREVTDDGMILVNDPASPEKTQKSWSFDEVNPEIYFIWDVYVEN